MACDYIKDDTLRFQYNHWRKSPSHQKSSDIKEYNYKAKNDSQIIMRFRYTNLSLSIHFILFYFCYKVYNKKC